MVKTDVQVQDHHVMIVTLDHKFNNRNLNLKVDQIVVVTVLHLLHLEVAAVEVQAAAVAAADQQEAAVDSCYTFTQFIR